MILDPIRFIIGGVFLFYASILDIKTRRVENRIWILLGAIGIILLHIHIIIDGNWYHHFVFLPILVLYTFPFIELEERPDLKKGIITLNIWFAMIGIGILGIILMAYYGGTEFFTLTLFGTCIFILLIYVMYFTGLIFGGADAKGMAAITLLVPFHTEFLGFPLLESEYQTVELLFTFPVVVLVLSVLVFAFLPIIMAFYNLTKRDTGLPMFFGYRMKIHEIPGKHVWLMEQPQYFPTDDIKLMTAMGGFTGMKNWLLENSFTGKLRMNYFPKKSDTNNMEVDIRILEKSGKNKVWVTPKIPFMVAIFGGFLLAFLVGDALFELMSWLIG